MAYAAFALSLFAVAVAFGSLVFTVRADGRATRAEGASRRARIIVEPRGGTGRGDQPPPRDFHFDVRNLGAVPARGVQLWLTERGGRRKVSSFMNAGNLVLPPGEPAERGRVEVQEKLEPDQLDVWIAWTDDEGPHEELRKEVRPT